jgi:hypothetical protein
VWAGLQWADQLFVESRVKEHYWHIPHGQMEKSAVEKCNSNCENTKIFSTKSRFMDHYTKEVMIIELDPSSVISRSWELLSPSLME